MQHDSDDKPKSPELKPVAPASGGGSIGGFFSERPPSPNTQDKIIFSDFNCLKGLDKHFFLLYDPPDEDADTDVEEDEAEEKIEADENTDPAIRPVKRCKR